MRRPVEEPKRADDRTTARQPSGVAHGTENGAEGGQVGGVAGGEAGGKVGGTVGGQGTEAIPVELAGRPPVVVSRIVPTYPETARLRGTEGQVVLRAIIGLDGRVEDGIRVVRSNPVFDAAAVAALQQWKFSPARDQAGRPVRVILTVPLRFQLR